LSDFVVVPEYCVVKIPDNVPLDVAGELTKRSYAQIETQYLTYCHSFG